ncbi:MAG: hypothetical protein AAGD17_13095, partial [Bacteroidota bacterium]
MKEIVLFTTSRSADGAILKLGELGVVDIQEINQPTNGTLETRTKAFNDSERALRILKEHIKKEEEVQKRVKYVVSDPKQLGDRILKTAEIQQKCRERLEDLNYQLDWYNTWGEKVNAKDILHLQKKGLYLRLYMLEKSTANSLKQKHTLVKLQEVDGKIPTVLITQDEAEKLNHEEKPLPKLPFEDVKQQVLRKKRQLAEVDHFLKDQTENIKWLEEYQLLLKDQLGIQQALEAMGDVEGKLKYLKGYIPKNTVADFIAAAKENHWGYHIADPEKPEEVPVYIKNPKWISIINPVMKFI